MTLYEIRYMDDWWPEEGTSPEKALAHWRDTFNADTKNTGYAPLPTPVTLPVRTAGEDDTEEYTA